MSVWNGTICRGAFLSPEIWESLVRCPEVQTESTHFHPQQLVDITR